MTFDASILVIAIFSGKIGLAKIRWSQCRASKNAQQSCVPEGRVGACRFLRLMRFLCEANELTRSVYCSVSWGSGSKVLRWNFLWKTKQNVAISSWMAGRGDTESWHQWDERRRQLNPGKERLTIWLKLADGFDNGSARWEFITERRV